MVYSSRNATNYPHTLTMIPAKISVYGTIYRFSGWTAAHSYVSVTILTFRFRGWETLMKSGLLILVGVLGAAVLVMGCPQSLRNDMAERTALPDHVYVEAERQLSIFVNWARSEGERPDAEEHAELTI